MSSDVISKLAGACPTLTALELESIWPLKKCAELRSDSVDTLKREDQKRVARGEPSQIVRLSARRRGMRLKHALKLAD
jgi:hypothetical protein